MPLSSSKHILLFGAGKSATVLIEYLKNLADKKKWLVTVADNNLEVIQKKIGKHAFVKPVCVNVNNEEERNEYIKDADIVISLMPPNLHYLIALSCVEHKKNLLTASYADEGLKELAPKIKELGILFLCEMGLDPGIDHMSAMQMLDDLKSKGARIISFKSHCGGLIAPESDDNPWHYKISWNPRNIVLAGKAGAVYREHSNEIHLPYEQLFSTNNEVKVPNLGWFSFYPNRDSLSYLPLYNLTDVETFVRTTLRHPDFCFGWKNIIDLKLTDEEKVYDTDQMSISSFFKIHFEKHGFTEWLTNLLSTRFDYAKSMMEQLMNLMQAEKEVIDEGEQPDDDFMMIDETGKLTTLNVDDVKSKAAESVAVQMHQANLTFRQLFFLGLNDEILINKGICSAADVLQFILETKLSLQPEDKDMIVMMHEIEYSLNNENFKKTSSLIVKGENSLHTAMAKTVGLPLGIAAELILENKIQETGLHIPVKASIYEPVLEALQKHGISFNETEAEV